MSPGSRTGATPAEVFRSLKVLLHNSVLNVTSNMHSYGFLCSTLTGPLFSWIFIYLFFVHPKKFIVHPCREIPSEY
jgi:hypothetical protein